MTKLMTVKRYNALFAENRIKVITQNGNIIDCYLDGVRCRIEIISFGK